MQYLLFCIVMLLAFQCKTKVSSSEKKDATVAISADSVALRFALAINKKDTSQLIYFTADTLTLVSQDWESVEQEPSLADSIHKLVYCGDNIKNGLNKLISEVTLENDSTISLLDSTMQYFSTINAVLPTKDGYVFLREMGDAEHVLIMVEGSNKKIKLIYLN